MNYSICRNNAGHIIWSEEQIQHIIQLYQSGVGTGQIGKKFENVSSNTIRNQLRKNNIPIRTVAEQQRFNFPRDSFFFNKIDSKEKAYWLGFLYADGNISAKENRITLNLQAQDEDALIKFRNALKAKNQLIDSQKIMNNKIHYMKMFAIKDKQLKTDLIALGCVPKKSLILEFPKDKIEQKYYLSFIRGYFDGDGSIHYTTNKKTNYKNYRISFLGTKNLINEIKSILKVDYLATQKNNNYYVLQINGNKQLNNILSEIYKDSTPEIRLNRKYNKFIEFQSYIGHRP